jgi:hypothetical protein
VPIDDAWAASDKGPTTHANETGSVASTDVLKEITRLQAKTPKGR